MGGGLGKLSTDAKSFVGKKDSEKKIKFLGTKLIWWYRLRLKSGWLRAGL